MALIFNTVGFCRISTLGLFPRIRFKKGKDPLDNLVLTFKCRVVLDCILDFRPVYNDSFNRVCTISVRLCHSVTDGDFWNFILM